MKTTKQLLLLALFGLVPNAFADTTLAQYFNVGGVLTDSSSAPLVSQTATVEFKIYDPSGSCVLYCEQQSVTTDAQGNFSAQVGSATGAAKRSACGSDPGYAMEKIFQNSQGMGCYTSPQQGDGRQLEVTVNGSVLSPKIALAAAPTATVAETLQGMAPASFVQYSAAPNLTPANISLMFNTSGWTNLQNVINGNYLQGQSNGSVLMTNDSVDPTTSLNKGQIWFNSSTNQLKYYDGTNVQTVINQNSITNIPASSITSGTIGGSVAVNTTGNVTAAGLSAKNVLVYNTSSTFAATIKVPAGLAANYSLTLPSNTGTANQVLTTDGTGILSWTTPTGGGGSQWTTSGSNIYYTTGGVGIGTVNPTVGLMDIVGTSGNPAVTGGTDPSVLFRIDNLTNALDMGVSNSWNSAWMQARMSAINGTIANMMMQPYGGSVSIGWNNPTGSASALDVHGSIRVSTDTNTCASLNIGAIRYNSPNIEYCNGTAWTAFLSGSAGNFLSTTSGGTISGATTINANLGVTGTSSFTGAMTTTGITNSGAGINSVGNMTGVGTITGTGPMNITAGSTNQSVTISGSGTGNVILSPSSGDVGIGTTAPAAGLDISGVIKMDQGLNSGHQYPAVILDGSKGVYGAWNGSSGGSVWQLAVNSGGNTTQTKYLRINTTNAIPGGDLFVLGPGGNVGIGPLSPGGTTFNPPMSMLDVAGGVGIGTYAGVSAAPANGMIVSGNVGIGTSYPSNNLLEVDSFTPSTSGPGLGVQLQGQQGSTSQPGGNITMQPGAAGAGGTPGYVQILQGGQYGGMNNTLAQTLYPSLVVVGQSTAHMLITNGQSTANDGVGGVNDAGLIINQYSNGNQASPFILLSNVNGTATSQSSTPAMSKLGGISAAGSFSGGLTNPTAAMTFTADEMFTNTAQGTSIAFQTTAAGTSVVSEKMRILGNGNVGIGTQAPIGALDVNIANSGVRIYNPTATNTFAGLILERSNTSNGGTALVGDYLGTLTFAGIDTTGSNTVSPAAIQTVVTGTPTSGTIPADLTFRVGAINGPAERMRITSTGTVGIGNQNPSATLDVTGHYGSSGSQPTVTTCGTSPSVTSGSTDTRGTITTGTASPTSCTINFVQPFSGGPQPTCVVSWRGTASTTAMAVTPTTSSLTVNFSSAVNSGSFSYICFQ